MKKYRSVIWQFFSAFFFIFGLLQFLFFVRAIFPQFRAISTNQLQILLCLGAAVLLSALHTTISIDGCESEYAIKARLIICGIPSVLIFGVLSINYGLPSLILDIFGVADKSAAIITWIIALIISLVAFVLGFYILEWHYRRVGKVYDNALDAYKTATGIGQDQ